MLCPSDEIWSRRGIVKLHYLRRLLRSQRAQWRIVHAKPDCPARAAGASAIFIDEFDAD
jgi:hypothetical protein